MILFDHLVWRVVTQSGVLDLAPISRVKFAEFEITPSARCAKGAFRAKLGSNVRHVNEAVEAALAAAAQGRGEGDARRQGLR